MCSQTMRGEVGGVAFYQSTSLKPAYITLSQVMMSLCKGETGVQEKVFSLTKITEHRHTPTGLFLRICALFHCEIVVIIFL
jgi:hypothetical protein